MTLREMTSWFGVFYVITLVTYVRAYYNGAAHSSCSTFDPGNNHGSQGPNPVPYSLLIRDTSTYTDGLPVQLQIKGAPFTGIILQARRQSSADWEPVSWFAVPNNSSGLRLMDCVANGDTITQMVAYNTLQDTIVTWIPPKGDEGDIYFMANVFKSKDIWYNNIKSSILKYKAPTTTAPSQTTTTTPTTTVTTRSADTPTPYYYSGSPAILREQGLWKLALFVVAMFAVGFRNLD